MSDRIATECKACGKVFAVGASFAGKKIRCPQCQGIIQVTGGNAPASPRFHRLAAVRRHRRLQLRENL